MANDCFPCDRDHGWIVYPLPDSTQPPERMSSKFPDPLIFQDAGHANGSMLLRLVSLYRYLSSFGTITVPANFITDGASIPRPFWAILSPFGDFFPAALVHDLLYSPLNMDYTRSESDEIFLEAMKDLGVPWHRRTVIYYAVRCAGWKFYKGQPE